MSRKVVITGGRGFVGQWLARSLLKRGDEVWLAGRGDRPAQGSILGRDEWSSVRWVPCDVRSDADVDRTIGGVMPDFIVHLAGVSSILTADRAPTEAYNVNLLGAVRIASTASRLFSGGKLDPLLLVIGSGTQYGAHPESEMPLPETAAQWPINAYASTKAGQEIAVLQTGRATGLRVICTRSFNHSGVGHGPAFILPTLAKRVGELPPTGGTLRIGNDVVRDYLHVEDVVDAYIRLGDVGTPGDVYNVCSGVGTSVRDLAVAALAQAGVEATIIDDTSLKRSLDLPVLVGSSEKLKQETGWRQRKAVTDIIDDLLAAEQGIAPGSHQ